MIADALEPPAPTVTEARPAEVPAERLLRLGVGAGGVSTFSRAGPGGVYVRVDAFVRVIDWLSVGGAYVRHAYNQECFDSCAPRTLKTLRGTALFHWRPAASRWFEVRGGPTAGLGLGSYGYSVPGYGERYDADRARFVWGFDAAACVHFTDWLALDLTAATIVAPGGVFVQRKTFALPEIGLMVSFHLP